MSIDVLFVSYGGSHIHMLKDVYRLLQTKVSTTFLALTLAEDVMQTLRLPYVSLNEFADDLPLIYDTLDRFGIKGNQSENIYTGIGLSELESNFGFEKAAALYAELGRAVLCPRKLAEKILVHFKPKIVVTSNMVRLARAMMAEANQLNIKTVFMEDAFCTPSHPFDKVALSIRSVVSPDIVVDYLISMSPDVEDSIRENLTRNYIVNQPEIHALGNPNVESSLNVKSQDNRFVPTEKYILLLSNKYFRDEIVELLKEYCGANPSVLLVIKIHPNETIEYYNSQFAQYENVSVVSDKSSLVPLIKAAEVILATNSTAAFEAHLLGKKIFCLNPMQSDYLIDHYVKRGIGENIQTSNELTRRIKEFEVESADYSPQIKMTLGSVNKVFQFLLELVNSYEK